MASLYLVDSLDGVTVGDPVSLDGAEGRHAVSVARVRVGEVLRIADGRGTVVSGPVTALGKDTLEARGPHRRAPGRTAPVADARAGPGQGRS